jgi:hypothetical protein
MVSSDCFRALSVFLYLGLIIINYLYDFDVFYSLVVVLFIASFLYLSYCKKDKKDNICLERNAEFHLIMIFVISLVLSVFFFSFSPIHVIVEPEAINETFTFPSGVNESIKTISIKNVGRDITALNITAEGNNIKDTQLLANQLNARTRSILADVSNMEATDDIDKINATSIRMAVTDLNENINYLGNGVSNLPSIFKNISIYIGLMNNATSSMDNNATIHDDLKILDSIKSNMVHNGTVLVLLSQSPKIESGQTEFVSVEIDASMASRNGEYKGAIIIETDDKKLRKEVPISIKIKGATSGSTESKAKEEKSVTFKSVTLNLTGSLGS